jgi:hypothetical protein
MRGSVEDSFLNVDQRRSLIELIAVVATALSEALKNTLSVYRDLRRALALLVAEIRHIELLQDALWRKELFQSLTDVAFGFNGALNGDYLKSNYQEALVERSRQTSLIQSWLTAPAAQARNSIHDWASIYPNLYILHELVRSLGHPEIRTRSLLTDDDSLVLKLTECLTYWNDLVDQVYGCEVIEYEKKVLESRGRKPFIGLSPFRDGHSVRHLTGTVYDVLHHNWPCQSESHDHTGKLGHCASANFYLDPSWGSKHPDSLQGGFFVLLAGSDILQECRVRLHSNG